MGEQEPTTLGEWRDFTSRADWTYATAFLDEKIQNQGRDAKTIAHSSQMIYLLADIERTAQEQQS